MLSAQDTINVLRTIARVLPESLPPGYQIDAQAIAQAGKAAKKSDRLAAMLYAASTPYGISAKELDTMLQEPAAHSDTLQAIALPLLFALRDFPELNAMEGL